MEKRGDFGALRDSHRQAFAPLFSTEGRGEGRRLVYDMHEGPAYEGHDL